MSTITDKFFYIYYFNQSHNYYVRPENKITKAIVVLWCKWNKRRESIASSNRFQQTSSPASCRMVHLWSVPGYAVISFCCQELEELEERIYDNDVDCITPLREFSVVVLEESLLKTEFVTMSLFSIAMLSYCYSCLTFFFFSLQLCICVPLVRHIIQGFS